MKKEFLARSLIFFFLAAAVAVPLGGLWLSSRAEPGTVVLHARMAQNGGWSLRTIQAAVGQPLHLKLTSDDVAHSFAIGKSDQPPIQVLPGEFVETTLVFDQPGTYTFYCDTWCGLDHWRMRGEIVVSGLGATATPEPQPLYLALGIDIDAPHLAAVVPASPPSSARGAQFAGQLPVYVLDPAVYQTTSPAQLWQKLRAEPALSGLTGADLWDAVAWAWQKQVTPAGLAEGQSLYATNCAACHGETGQGNGVMVRGLPALDYQNMGHTLVHPPDFTDPQVLSGASPALLEGKIVRGGMGTGMPYWGPIFTHPQIEDLISYLYTFAWQTKNLR